MVATSAPRARTTAASTRSPVFLKKRSKRAHITRRRGRASPKVLQELTKIVLQYYRTHGRHELPWRKTVDPYQILVSEVMLQQTQVDRVVPKFSAFIERYPNADALAQAPLVDVLRLWQGLGYNRRAKYLWEASKRWGGVLEELPGVGPYTANAVRVFAHNEPRVLIETNIRAVYLHHLFPRRDTVADAEIIPHIRVPRGVQPRVWYAALMDYGSHLKKSIPNPSRRSRHHARQKPFKGSDREIRGALVRAALTGSKVTGFPARRVRAIRKALRAEGLI
ncbi:A/G-specific adenine glycosylase [Patescibacteria group bacterium]|nr:A/G-specific adenine glycosylase [Patescibacteria group bacterium]